ncbi:hypothetical protein SARC_03190 [Sphaeroforma arctica JP610]|uniref:Trichome birefringence-like C-terminal domain-containing protein n=1 Tax=Sphaeroforma arctica JP610 TaxID=667725 RepID=A0A0L0G8P6_9EUKA|nr:hypothetical protein SARC_03190 [Sphaeroforma arctica JP610]KNC84593.1 hypothetical protein SARC_03190 [Sphaeroforma arctica JP610]|eukprot:XP_014158495.1 hypothetical protein SARC_03190 [Sphaeroforma arctica JP610]
MPALHAFINSRRMLVRILPFILVSSLFFYLHKCAGGFSIATWRNINLFTAQPQQTVPAINPEWLKGQWVYEPQQADIFQRDLHSYTQFPSIDKDCIWFKDTAVVNGTDYLNWRWLPVSGVQASHSTVGLLTTNYTATSGSKRSLASQPLRTLSRSDIFKCLAGINLTYYGDSLSRQMGLSLGGQLFDTSGTNPVVGNDGYTVEYTKAQSTDDMIPVRLNFRDNAKTHTYSHEEKGRKLNVTVTWAQQNWWVGFHVVNQTVFSLHPYDVSANLVNLVTGPEPSQNSSVIVLALAHWWTMKHWGNTLTVDFAKYPELRLSSDINGTEQLLRVYDRAVETTVNYIVSNNFTGTVVWRTSTSMQYDSKNTCAFEHPLQADETTQMHNVGAMNDILRKHVKPVVAEHPNHLLLDVEALTLRRNDALAFRGGHHDCTHWCLPGVPDLWNQIMLNAIC